ncbi:hypothetical protein JW835_08465 [bacterium]|nr:hypothetical protein [bacterium]
MSNEKKRILEMLSQNKINVDEAERLLAAIEEPSDGTNANPEKKMLKYLRVLVEPIGPDSKGDRVNVRIPMNLIRAGLKWISLIPKEARGKVESALNDKGIDMDFKKLRPEDFEEILFNLNDLQVEVDGGEKVRVFCE